MLTAASSKAQIHNMSASCGYDDYISKYLTFPPPGPFPVDLPGTDETGSTTAECDVFDAIYSEIFYVNPCWDIYQVATTCPELWDVLGFPGSFSYLPAGAEIYFNRTDVQKAINAPLIEWDECTNTDVFINNTDNSLPSGLSVLPGVIERSKRTVIGHGALDMVLISNGTLLMINNMTWNGAQGFTSKPADPFYVPYHSEGYSPDFGESDPGLSVVAASGVFGTTHTERGLTWVSVDLSGHSKSPYLLSNRLLLTHPFPVVPQYAPTAAYRHLEFLLGRIDSLSSTVPFTTDDFPQPDVPLGNGTAPPTRRMRI